jgi:mxaD protein
MKRINTNLLLPFTFLCSLLFAVANANAAGQLKVEKTLEVDASAATVWKMIGDYNHLDVWHPVVVDCTVDNDNNKLGATRTLTLADGANIIEELVAHSDNDKTYTYSIKESPLPINHYVSTISVRESSDGKSSVTWSTNFNAEGVEDAKASEIIAGIYDAGLGALSKHFSK